jgi:hypothetical protein
MYACHNIPISRWCSCPLPHQPDTLLLPAVLPHPYTSAAMYMLNPVYFTSFNKFVTDTPFTTKTGDLPGLRIDKVYNDLHTCKVIYTLCDVALNATALVGGFKRKTNRKQKGGGEDIYDKVSFDTDEFIIFLKNTLFVRVANIKEDLETIQVIYDEKNELNKNGNENILVIYDC